MSDMKLYRGINNIDDDLIEEAEREHKPVIHRYYSFAASAAALLIAVGVSGWGLFRGDENLKDPSLFGSNVISETSTTVPSEQPTAHSSTEAVSSSADAVKADIGTVTVVPVVTDPNNKLTTAVTSYNIAAEPVQTASPVPSASINNETASADKVTAPAVTDAKVNNTPTAAVTSDRHAQTSVQTAVTVNFTTAPEVTVTAAVTKTNEEYEYEGRIVMKKFFAMSAALLTIANAPVLSVKADSYTPVNKVQNRADEARSFIEDYNVDIDLNSDGKFDIIDLYAFYVAEDAVKSEDGDKMLPKDVLDKFNVIPVNDGVKTTEIDPDTGKEYEYYKGYYKLDSTELACYYLTYNDMDLSYFDHEFYTENCPEGYDTSEKMVSEFIDYCLRYEFFESGRSYNYMKDMIEKEELDMDINSDGEFNFDDVLLLLCFRANVGTDYYEKQTSELLEDHYHNYKAYSDYYDTYCADPDIDWGIYRQPYKITESEFNKACTYFDTASKYIAAYYNEDIQLEYLVKYYLSNNKIEKKYFDPDYYSYDESFKYHCYEYEYRNMNTQCYTYHYNSYDEPFFGNYSYYLDFAFKFGKGVIDDYVPTDEDVNRYNFSQEDIEAAFPTYYKNVKTGVLPEPDMDLNGIINVADYSILYNLNCENISPFDEFETSKLIRTFPELQVKIKVLPEIRDNYNTKFDFNENGVSCDVLETECMMMYILNELDSVYSTEDEFTEACEYYIHSHPGINYEALLLDKMNRFNAGRESYDFDYKLEATDTVALSDSVNTLSSYMSGIDLSVLRTGDANCDNETGLADALLILQNSANSVKYPVSKTGEFNADVFGTGDGLTPMDALEIQKWDAEKSI